MLAVLQTQHTNSSLSSCSSQQVPVPAPVHTHLSIRHSSTSRQKQAAFLPPLSPSHTIAIHSDPRSCPLRLLISPGSIHSSPASPCQPSLHHSLPGFLPSGLTLLPPPPPLLPLSCCSILLAISVSCLQPPVTPHCLADKSQALRWALETLHDLALCRVPPSSQAFATVYFPLFPVGQVSLQPTLPLFRPLSEVPFALPLPGRFSSLSGIRSTDFSRLGQASPLGSHSTAHTVHLQVCLPTSTLRSSRVGTTSVWFTTVKPTPGQRLDTVALSKCILSECMCSIGSRAK